MIGSFINLLVLCFSYYDLLFNWFFLNWNLHLKVTRKTNIKNKHIKQPNQKVEKKTSTDISPKKKYRWLTNTWKDAQYYSLSEKCKSKPLWGTISHQSEWLQSKSLQARNAGEGVEKRKPSYTVVVFAIHWHESAMVLIRYMICKTSLPFCDLPFSLSWHWLNTKNIFL